MKTGFRTGRITSISQSEAKKLNAPYRRRYVYNQSKCLICHGRIKSFSEASRTVWFCPGCQQGGIPSSEKSSKQVFHSKCASEPLVLRKSNPLKLKVKELKTEIAKYGLTIPNRSRKADLVKILSEHMQDLAEHTADYVDDDDNTTRVHGYNQRLSRFEKKNEKKEAKKRKVRSTSKVRRSRRRRV